ncbi:MAG: hypothetical protein JRI68_13040 [Deltaproteobacteria bacterium]|nr:hypothetical protein [Deltaproteobacteria bacterium]
MKAQALKLLPLLATALAVTIVHGWVAAQLSLLTEFVLVLVVGGGTYVLVGQLVSRWLTPP